ncbi:GspH/FimT family pseudopilin [Amphritea sp. HPY]|uniref:GspH/FimT family pseudopilin n=1 Tax=Amphritea sp. HPY TaxID=3421652 RepID=UPI003D7CFCF2
MRYTGQTRNKGFTLIELMVTVAVMALLLTVGAPAMGSFLQNSQLDSTVDQLKNIYSFTRQEAVHRQQVVSLCAFDTQNNTCGNSWNDGALVYIDRDGAAGFGGTDLRLREVEFTEGVTVVWTGSENRLDLEADGSTDDAAQFTISVQGMDGGIDMDISLIGRARITESEEKKSSELSS